MTVRPLLNQSNSIKGIFSTDCKFSRSFKLRIVGATAGLGGVTSRDTFGGRVVRPSSRLSQAVVTYLPAASAVAPVVVAGCSYSCQGGRGGVGLELFCSFYLWYILWRWQPPRAVAPLSRRAAVVAFCAYADVVAGSSRSRPVVGHVWPCCVCVLRHTTCT